VHPSVTALFRSTSFSPALEDLLIGFFDGLTLSKEVIDD